MPMRQSAGAIAVPVPGVTMPGQFGPMRRVFLPAIAAFTFTISLTGMPSVIATTRSSSASTDSKMASAANGGGTKITETVAPVCFAASETVSKIGTFVFKKLAALSGSDTGDDLRAVFEAELGVPRAEAAGDALDEDAGLWGYEN